MIKRYLALFFLLIGITISFSQVTDTIAKTKTIDTIPIAPKIDSLPRIDSLKVYTKNEQDSIAPVLTKLDSIKMQFDELLKPYYIIDYDSVFNQYTYTPKYRVNVNTITEDTVYVKIPTEKTYIKGVNRLVFDTLKIDMPLPLVHIDTTPMAQDPVWWESFNSFGLDISESAFLNWSSGGNNSIAGLFRVNFVRSYKKLHVMWHNEVFVRYGLNIQESKGLRKTDDRLELNTTFGYRGDTNSNWFYSAKVNYRTQFTDGFRYPDKKSPISRFMAPGYLFVGAGTEYNPKDAEFVTYVSPITLKSTFVLDDKLSASGAFGVEKGKKSRHQFGALVSIDWRKEIFKNILMTNDLDLYSDYLNSFGNIDVDWQLNFLFKINKHIKASLGSHLIYDDDVKHKEDINGDGKLDVVGARVQIKQLFGIGFVFSF